MKMKNKWYSESQNWYYELCRSRKLIYDWLHCWFKMQELVIQLQLYTNLP